MHALPVNLPCVKQLPVITNEAGASLHAGSTCAIGVVTVRPFNRQPAQLYFKLTPNPNNTFFFIFTCTTQYPWVLANPDLSQAMASSKQKRTHTVFCASSTHRSASTSKPRFVGEKVRLGDVLKSSSTRNKDNRCANVYSVTNSKGFVPSEEYFSKEVFSKELRTYRIVARNMLAYNPSRINVGSVALQDKADEVVVSPLYVVFSTDTSKLMPEYLVHFLKSKPGLDQIAFQSIGTVRNNLKYKALCQMELRIPSLGEQQARLNTLREVQLQIEQAESQIAELDQLAKSRFVEIFGDLKLNKYNWPIEPFESFAVIDTHMANNLDAYANKPHIGIDSIESNSGRLSGYRTVAEDGIISGKYPFTAQHIIYSKIRPALNKVALPDFDGVCSADAYPILPAKERCNRIYLAQVMRSSCFLDYVLPLSGRAQMPKVNKKALQGFSMPLPPLELQQEFATFVSQVDKSRFVRDHEINFR